MALSQLGWFQGPGSPSTRSALTGMGGEDSRDSILDYIFPPTHPVTQNGDQLC